ncbi:MULTISPECIES: DMT family transporter [unclassified Fibrobacter]|uniref:DMT family transporter n=1 Tax=unclassified Fibrobacter TaxID=2634177 RepID=UPI000D7B05E2|nr:MULTISPECIES: EamA family transporter [unclassified Fibrobacter]PWJ69953.1 threonine/homoserine efflux transporter RhtA [Fibrobacter sp. UWR4]PZW73124.1 threonine/homoserine efflux transporter RhtA [Fibrobacter sp. UWR1]
MKGFVFGCLAGVSYGTNPLGALHLYKEGFSPDTVLCYRFAWAVLLLALLMVFGGKGSTKKKSLAETFCVKKRELPVLIILGILFAACALMLFASFNYMSAGLASTLLFLYPMEVALIMGLFFKEKMTAKVAVSIGLSLAGVVLLYRGGEGGEALSTVGVLLVILSSLFYAIYIVVVNKADLQMGSVKLTFYVMLFCLMSLLVYSISFGSGIPPVPANLNQLGWGFMLGLVPSVMSLVFMAKAVKLVGSTPTAIMGALEPLTAVVIGVMVFGENLTGRLMAGIILILVAVTLLAIKKKA